MGNCLRDSSHPNAFGQRTSGTLRRQRVGSLHDTLASSQGTATNRHQNVLEECETRSPQAATPSKKVEIESLHMSPNILRSGIDRASCDKDMPAMTKIPMAPCHPTPSAPPMFGVTHPTATNTKKNIATHCTQDQPGLKVSTPAEFNLKPFVATNAANGKNFINSSAKASLYPVATLVSDNPRHISFPVSYASDLPPSPLTTTNPAVTSTDKKAAREKQDSIYPGYKVLRVCAPPGVAGGAVIQVTVPDEEWRVLFVRVPTKATEFNVAYRPTKPRQGHAHTNLFSKLENNRTTTTSGATTHDFKPNLYDSSSGKRPPYHSKNDKRSPNYSSNNAKSPNNNLSLLEAWVLLECISQVFVVCCEVVAIVGSS